MEQKAISPFPSLTPVKQAELMLGVQQFFNGDSLETIETDLRVLLETTITESYGSLDSEDKWLLVDLVKRLNGLVVLANDFLNIIENENAEASPEENDEDENSGTSDNI